MKTKTKKALVNDIEDVLNSLKAKRKYLKEDTIPKALSKETLLDEDINYLEDEVLRTVKNISVD